MNKITIILVLLMNTAVIMTSCGSSQRPSEPTTVKAKVKYKYPVVGNNLSIIEVDPLYEPGDDIFYDGITYTIISIDRNDEQWLNPVYDNIDTISVTEYGLISITFTDSTGYDPMPADEFRERFGFTVIRH